MKFKFLFVLIPILFIHSLEASSSGEEEISSPPLPRAMAVLGDSMSEGMLAAYSLENRPSFSDVADMLILAAGKTKPERIAAFRKYYARKDRSWASGSQPNDLVVSHFERLRKLRPSLKVENFAVSSSETRELPDQIERLEAAENAQGFPFDYITLLMGANDLAGITRDEIVPPLQFVQNIETNLRRLLDEYPERAILLVGLPDVHTIFERSADFVVYSYYYDTLKCHSMRRQIYGAKLLFFPDREDDYEFTKQVFQQYGLGLAELVERLKEEYPSSFIKMAKQNPLPTNIRKALSIDCFHPSEWGQAELAEVTWARGFWPNLGVDDFDTWN